MTIEEMVIVCKAHEGIQAGLRNCKYINEAYKLISNKKVTKNKKILTIEEYFNRVRAETLGTLIVRKEAQKEFEEIYNIIQENKHKGAEILKYKEDILMAFDKLPIPAQNKRANTLITKMHTIEEFYERTTGIKT